MPIIYSKLLPKQITKNYQMKCEYHNFVIFLNVFSSVLLILATGKL